MRKNDIDFEMYALGESAVTVKLQSGSDDVRRKLILQLDDRLKQHPFDGYIESVPAPSSLTVYYDPFQIARNRKTVSQMTVFQLVKQWLLHDIDRLNESDSFEGEEVRIPVVYGGELGPDLEYAAAYCGCSVQQLIERHTKPLYTVQMIGFAPGFPYLSGMDESIAVPRQHTPRPFVAAGSVGIAGKQTGIYSIDSPGGWNIIGRTPMKLFQPERDEPTLLRAGMKIRFYSIGLKEYEELIGK